MAKAILFMLVLFLLGLILYYVIPVLIVIFALGFFLYFIWKEEDK